MKRCPVCNRSYGDTTLNYCEEDGATLVAYHSGYGQSSGYSQPSSAAHNFGAVYSATRPASQSKASALPWVLGVFATLILLAVAGFIALVALVGTLPDDNKNNSSGTRANSNKTGIFDSTSTTSKTSSSGFKIDFTRWSEFDKADGVAKVMGDEFQLACKQSNYFYVMIASTKFEDKFVTNNATARVTVRSVTGDAPGLGYGIVVDSDIEPLKEGYAFLISNGSSPKYRVVRHINRKETVVKDWTAAAQIRSGTQPNQLEVRSDGKTMSFYINGQLATNVTDENGSEKGIVGIYTSDTKPVGFSNLEIIKN